MKVVFYVVCILIKYTQKSLKYFDLTKLNGLVCYENRAIYVKFLLF